MRHVVVYDISPDGVRTAVSRVLEGVGNRIQESVFECDLESAALTVLTAPCHGAGIGGTVKSGSTGSAGIATWRLAGSGTVPATGAAPAIIVG